MANISERDKQTLQRMHEWQRNFSGPGVRNGPGGATIDPLHGPQDLFSSKQVSLLKVVDPKESEDYVLCEPIINTEGAIAGGEDSIKIPVIKAANNKGGQDGKKSYKENDHVIALRTGAVLEDFRSGSNFGDPYKDSNGHLIVWIDTASISNSAFNKVALLYPTHTFKVPKESDGVLFMFVAGAGGGGGGGADGVELVYGYNHIYVAGAGGGGGGGGQSARVLRNNEEVGKDITFSGGIGGSGGKFDTVGESGTDGEDLTVTFTNNTTITVKAGAGAEGGVNGQGGKGGQAIGGTSGANTPLDGALLIQGTRGHHGGSGFVWHPNEDRIGGTSPGGRGGNGGQCNGEIAGLTQGGLGGDGEISQGTGSKGDAGLDGDDAKIIIMWSED